VTFLDYIYTHYESTNDNHKTKFAQVHNERSLKVIMWNEDDIWRCENVNTTLEPSKLTMYNLAHHKSHKHFLQLTSSSQPQVYVNLQDFVDCFIDRFDDYRCQRCIVPLDNWHCSFRQNSKSHYMPTSRQVLLFKIIDTKKRKSSKLYIGKTPNKQPSNHSRVHASYNVHKNYHNLIIFDICVQIWCIVVIWKTFCNEILQ